MRRKQCRSLWLGVSILAVLTLSPGVLGQTSPFAKADIPLPTDWTHRHVIFSKPATAEEAARAESDPRYWQQQYRSELRVAMAHEADTDSGSPEAAERALNQGGFWETDMGTGASLGPGNYAAKFSFSLTTANCGSATQPDFVVYNTGLVGSSTQASLVAYDNLYSGCHGAVPSFYWAYNTGGQILTSTVYSADGTQLAFTQTEAGFGYLVLVKWKASTTESVTSPMTLSPLSPSAYETCVTPCMTTIQLIDPGDLNANDTNSSVFYDYVHDTAWVGDNLGYLHKFTPLFKGTPAEVTTGGWPVKVNPSNPNTLTDPVHDSGSGNVFVGDAGGYLYLVTPTGVVTKSAQLDFGVGIVQGPFVDSTSGLVYVFASSDNSAACAGGANCAAVYQLKNNFSAGSSGSEVHVGVSTKSGSNPNPMYLGTFDSTYQNSKGGTGNLYVCGNTGGPPTIYQIPVNSGLMGAPVTGPVLASNTTPCSPLTDVPNPNVPGGATEWIFAGVRTFGISSICGTFGCGFNLKVTPWKASTSYSVGQEVLASDFQIQVVSGAGTSGVSTPAWNTVTGQSTSDGTVQWLDQGPSVGSRPAWAANKVYTVGTEIVDSNNNVQLVTTAGTSGTTHPTWSSTAGTPTTDNTVAWENVGASATAALLASGGTSGFIIDNFVETPVAGSQVYFSTLGRQNCQATGAGGCAIQASQAAMH